MNFAAREHRLRNRMSDRSALANPIPAFIAASCFSNSSLLLLLDNGKRGVRRSGASIMCPEKTTSFGIETIIEGIGLLQSC